MSDEKTSDGKKLKSAYELALERMAERGIEPPREEALTDEVRQQVADVRQKSEAKLAELEILHRDGLRKAQDPLAREKAEEDYQRERRRLEDERERKVAKLRG
jgi:hypothetical protein